MILYIHTYENNAITVKPISVKETDKLFKTTDYKKRHFPGFRNQIYKTELGKPQLRKGYQYYLIDLQPKVEFFKSFIKSDMEDRINRYEKSIASEKKELEQLKTADVIIQEVQENEK